MKSAPMVVCRGALLATVALTLGCQGTAVPTDPAPSEGTVEASMSEQRWGEVDGMEIELYALRNANGLVARVTNFGAILVQMLVPDREGELADVVLGFDAFDDYVERNTAHFGSTVGRVANRIAGARFELDGVEYGLAANNGAHHLHGGDVGFDRVVWEAEHAAVASGVGVRFRYVSQDGEEGYPGTVTATVLYNLTDEDELRVEMTAQTDQATLVNLAHHSYWNLAGEASGSVADHRIQILASHYTPADATLIPTGEIASVEGTPYDLRQPRRLGDALDELAASSDRSPSGFDDNFAADGAGGELRPVAVLEDPATGRRLELESDQPGLQLYTGNFLGELTGKGGVTYQRQGALCLETQLFPDAIHHLENDGWASPVLRPGERYRHRMVHRFSTVP